MNLSCPSVRPLLVVKLASLIVAACACGTSSRVLSQNADDARLAGDRGVPVSGSAPSFMPKHITGPNAGKEACPLCVYGLGPQFQLWVEEAKLDAVLPLVREIDALAQRSPAQPKDKKQGFVPYVVIAAREGGKVSDHTRNRVRSLPLKRVFFVEVPSWDDVETSGLYGHSMRSRPGSRAYLVINRRVFQRWDGISLLHLDDVARTLEQGRRFVSTYDLVDAQIAPAWEPGQRMVVRFRVVDRNRRSVTKQRVDASQTNKDGLYNPRGWNRRQPVLFTSAWTDDSGWISFDTIMPGPYPGESEPAHIHFSTTIRGKAQFRTLNFEGDPLLTREKRAWVDQDKETVIVAVDGSDNPWRVEHTFVLD